MSTFLTQFEAVAVSYVIRQSKRCLLLLHNPSPCLWPPDHAQTEDRCDYPFSHTEHLSYIVKIMNVWLCDFSTRGRRHVVVPAQQTPRRFIGYKSLADVIR